MKRKNSINLQELSGIGKKKWVELFSVSIVL